MEDISKSFLAESYSMNGGDGPYSYANNSSYQRGIVEAGKNIIKEEINTKLDIQQLYLSPKTLFRIADFGCASGPNTFIAMQMIIEAIELKFKSQGLDSKIPEFQVLFNDQVDNDFNHLFKSLPPKRPYFAAGVPGSFYRRLFPKASLHFGYSSCALCLLSKMPKELTDETSPAFNRGRIHYKGAPKEVEEAYHCQFFKDMKSFLDAREQEIVGGGFVAMAFPIVPDVMLQSHTSIGSECELLGSCLMDMVNMGIVSEAKVDAFNLPVYHTTQKEVKAAIEQSEGVSIERLEILKSPDQHNVLPNPKLRTLFLRAIFEEIIQKHFGSEITSGLFHRYSTKVENSSFFLNPDNHKQPVIFVVLQRNM